MGVYWGGNGAWGSWETGAHICTTAAPHAWLSRGPWDPAHACAASHAGNSPPRTTPALRKPSRGASFTSQLHSYLRDRDGGMDPQLHGPWAHPSPVLAGEGSLRLFLQQKAMSVVMPCSVAHHRHTTSQPLWWRANKGPGWGAEMKGQQIWHY